MSKGLTDPANDPSLRSWLPVESDSDFPIQNLPFGVFRAEGGAPSVGVAIGDHILALAVLHESRMFAGTMLAAENVFAHGSLNPLMEKGRAAWSAARRRISELLRADNYELRDNRVVRPRALVAQTTAEMLMPAAIGDYIDFYSSREHAANVGALFRGPQNALPANWLHLPIGYHGRAGSIVASPHDVRRPKGQIRPNPEADPIFSPSRRLDFELEVGFLIGVGNGAGDPISTAQARDHIFGAVLLNDWSARDIQRWEYQPLGPFLGKSFSTLISPWVVTLEALEPFRAASPPQDPAVMPYLRYEGEWGYDLRLEVWLQTVKMNQPAQITATNFRYLYWNILQQLAHATVNGARTRPGDLFASGTVSGPSRDSLGSMLEMSLNGKEPMRLPDGEERSFLEDGDRVILRGYCQGGGYRIGFGECSGRVLSAD